MSEVRGSPTTRNSRKSRTVTNRARTGTQPPAVLLLCLLTRIQYSSLWMVRCATNGIPLVTASTRNNRPSFAVASPIEHIYQSRYISYVPGMWYVFIFPKGFPSDVLPHVSTGIFHLMPPLKCRDGDGETEERRARERARELPRIRCLFLCPWATLPEELLFRRQQQERVSSPHSLLCVWFKFKSTHSRSARATSPPPLH